MKVICTKTEMKVTGLGNNKIMFFARVWDEKYVVIFGPDNCLPQKAGDPFELWDAKVAIGEVNEDMDIYEVTHGHKYWQGGGFVEFGGTCSLNREQFFFRLPEHKKESTFNGVPVEEVYEVC